MKLVVEEVLPLMQIVIDAEKMKKLVSMLFKIVFSIEEFGINWSLAT